MNIAEVKEQLITLINAGGSTLDMKYHDEQVEAFIPSLRQEAIVLKYNGSRTLAASKRINGSWVQKYETIIDSTIQSNDLEYLRVIAPSAIQISTMIGGDIYIGKKNKTSAFYRCQTRDELQTLKNRGFINNGKQIFYLYSDGEFEIYGDKSLQSFWRESILSNPIQKPNFDIENDEYPIGEDLLLIMADIYKQKMNIAIQQVKDPVIDASVTNESGNIKSNLR